MANPLPLAYYDLTETLSEPGCAVCALCVRDVSSFLDSLLYERVNEPETHLAFRARRGLCNEHGWQLLDYKGGVVGIAVLYQATLDEALKALRNASPMEALPSSFVRRLGGSGALPGVPMAERLESTGSCPACRILGESEARYVRTFCEHIGDERLQESYNVSDGLCLPHFRVVLRGVRSADDLQYIVATQKDIWDRLKAELAEFIDKNDYRRTHESVGPEGDSWRRTIARMAGEKGLFGVDRHL
ncbi:MAG TPA: DUF6062 family protein [Aggregatilineales bacterium]|nr:DUF6062 family protein [Aggregatilineales bacterium]